MSDGLRLLTSLIEHGSTSSFRLLDRNLFVDSEEQSAYDFIRSHFRRYSELPRIQTVEQELDIELPDAPETIDFYLTKVQDRSMFNAVRPVFNSMRESLIRGSSEEVRQHVSRLYSACRVHNASHDLRTIGELGDELLRNYNQVGMTDDLTGVPTGWPTLDRETGGYQNGDLVVWAARPGVGKTHALIHQAKTSWMSGYSILFVSMEMTLSQIANRFYGHYANLDPDLIRKKRLSSWKYPKLVAAVQELDSSNRFHLYAGNMGKRADDIDILIQELSPDIIYLDGMYLVMPANAPRNTNRYERVGYVLDELKRMTIERDRPIVSTTQLNREAAGKKSKKAGLETLGYSDAIGTHSSVVLGMKMPDKVSLSRPNARFIEIFKGREGEAENFTINYSLTPVDFSECQLEDDTDSGATSRRGTAEIDLNWMA